MDKKHNESLVELNIGLFDLVELAREIAARYVNDSSGFSIKIEGLSGAEIQGDKERLSEALSNLFQIAYEHNRNSTVYLNSQLAEDGLTVEVRIPGFHLNDEEQSNLLEIIYSRHGSSVTDDLLSATLEIVEAHGGKIWLRSSGNGHGTSFIFSLPFKDMRSPIAEFGDDHTPYSLPDALFHTHQNRPSVLIIGNDRSVVTLLNVTFDSAGWNVLNARNNTEALNKIAEHRPDVILLDSNSPAQDLVTTLNRIRKLDVLRLDNSDQLPLILLGATPVAPDFTRSTGIANYLLKPFEPDELLNMVEKVFSHSRIA